MITAIVNGSSEFKGEVRKNALFVDGKEIPWDIVKVDANRFHVIHNKKSYTIDVISADSTEKTFELRVNNQSCHVKVRDRFDELLHELGMDNLQAGKVHDIKAPMPGLVVDVRVQSGQQIKKGDGVVVLEAMKMENILKATADATVKAVIIKKGAKVEKNEVLVTLQ